MMVGVRRSSKISSRSGLVDLLQADFFFIALVRMLTPGERRGVSPPVYYAIDCCLPSKESIASNRAACGQAKIFVGCKVANCLAATRRLCVAERELHAQ